MNSLFGLWQNAHSSVGSLGVNSCISLNKLSQHFIFFFDFFSLSSFRQSLLLVVSLQRPEHGVLVQGAAAVTVQLEKENSAN